MEFLHSFISIYPALFALTLVILVEWMLPVANKYTPAIMFSVLAGAISKKVAHSGSEKQQILAGWLALTTYLFLIAVIVGSVLFAVTNDIWTQAVLLYFSLGYQQVANHAKEIQSCILQGQKSAARSLLAQVTEFDVSKLSDLGVNKLILESLTARFVSFWLVPCLLFLLFDGFTAFMYRALLEAYLVWQPATPHFQHFGLAVFKVKNAIEAIPTLLFAPIFSVFKSSPQWIRLVRSTKSQWLQAKVSSFNSLIWLSIIAAGCKTELAGPLMLQQQKIARPRINQGEHLEPAIISQLLKWNNRFRLSLILFNTITLTTLWLVYHFH